MSYVTQTDPVPAPDDEHVAPVLSEHWHEQVQQQTVIADFLWRSSYCREDPAAVRVVVVHDIKEEEGARQKEVQEAEGDEERESEADGEVGERVTQRAHETWR